MLGAGNTPSHHPYKIYRQQKRRTLGCLRFLDKHISLIMIKIMITTVTGKNQITIPAKIVRALDIESGMRLDWDIDENNALTVRLLPQRGQLARLAAGMGAEWLPDDADPVTDLIRERVQDDEDEGLA